jgi:hypothetical protein
VEFNDQECEPDTWGLSMALGKTISRSLFSKRLGLDYDSKKSGLNNALRSQSKRNKEKKAVRHWFPLENQWS